jgi:hypothetical protein
MTTRRKATSASILGHFSFLAAEFGLQKRSVGGADEWIDRYQDDSTAVTITLSYPELPLVALVVKRPAARAYVLSLERNARTRAIKRRYYAMLEHNAREPPDLVDLQHELADLQAGLIRRALEQLRSRPAVSPGAVWVDGPKYLLA